MPLSTVLMIALGIVPGVVVVGVAVWATKTGRRRLLIAVTIAYFAVLCVLLVLLVTTAGTTVG